MNYFIDNKKIKLVMESAKVSRKLAIKALKDNSNNVSEAIMDLTDDSIDVSNF